MYSLVVWAWSSHSTDLSQIKADRRESHKCGKLQRSTWVLAEGLMLSARLELRREYGSEDQEGVQELGKRRDFRQRTSSHNPYFPCGREEVPSESLRAQWPSLGCCQGTSAAPKWDAGKVYSVGLWRTKMAAEIIQSFPALHSNLSSCS